jgi:hypothetical protein
MSGLALEPTQPAVQQVPEFFLRIKGPGHEVDHLPPSSAEVKNEWSCTSTPPICLYVVERNNFVFTLLTFIYLYIYVCVCMERKF